MGTNKQTNKQARKKKKKEAFRVLKKSLLKLGKTLSGQMREMDLCVNFATAASF